MSPFWPTILPFLITNEGDGILSMAAANRAGSIPTSWGVAVCQPPNGYSAALVCGKRIGSDVLAPAEDVMLAAAIATVRNDTMDSAISRVERFVFPLVRLDVRRRCFRERFSDICYLNLFSRHLAAPLAYTSIEGTPIHPLLPQLRHTEPHRDWGGFRFVRTRLLRTCYWSSRRVLREFKDRRKYSELLVIMSIYSLVFFITVPWQLPCDG